METITIDILNPGAKKIIFELAELKLIAINKSPDFQTRYKMLLDKLRSNCDSAPSLEEITREVESVRAQRYAKREI